MNYLQGNEFATDISCEGKTYSFVTFYDEYGKRTFWTTEKFKRTNIELSRKEIVRGVEKLNTPICLKPEADIIVDFESDFRGSRDTWYSKETLRKMVKQTVVLPEPKIVDNGHCRAMFRPKVVRRSGNHVETTEGKGSRKGTDYIVSRAFLAITWEIVEGTQEVYNPATIPRFDEIIETTRELNEEEKQRANNILAQCFEE